MKSILFAILIISLFAIRNLSARPISYSGGTTLMQKNNSTSNSFHLHYSPTYKYSIGYKSEYLKKQKMRLNGVQINNLLKRVNKTNSQANLYLKYSLGNLSNSNINKLYGFVGLAGDFETRSFFISYANRYYDSGKELINFYQDSLQIGFDPFLKDYDNIHSWFMLRVDHKPELAGDEIITTPLIRFLKGTYLTEIGYSSNKRLLFNIVLRF